ncbi:unnamed protein product [Durusdinium trenchii]|uniref:Uncharacterized protein n=1 Tax=Durusdinium trenchii TaxID=1381693 RepID=A0ABP0SGR8_9DINO
MARESTQELGPSIWQIMQCSTILKEALEDVRAATKTCKQVDAGLQVLAAGLKRKQALRKKCHALWQRIRPKLVAYSVLWKIIDTHRRTEMNWEALRRLVATPKASEQKSEVEAHWDKVLRLVTTPKASECTTEVETDEEPLGAFFTMAVFTPLAPAVCA